MKIALALVTLAIPHLLRAQSTAYPCFRFGYSEEIEMNRKTLPEGVKVLKKVGPFEGDFLANDSGKPLVIKLDNSRYIKLVEGKHYEGNNEGNSNPPLIRKWTQEDSDTRIQSHTRINSFVRRKTVPDVLLYGSNEARPAKPQDVEFEIPAYFDGASIRLRGTMSFVPKDRDCK